MLLLAAIVAWAGFARLDEVAVADGEVVPQGHIKVIQHLEGGIIREIHVKEGDAVAAGDTLVNLDLGIERLNREQLVAELDSLLLVRERLEATVGGKSLKFPEAPEGRQPAVVGRERDSYNARKAEIASALNVIHKQIQQRKLAVHALRTRREALRRDIVLARENLAMTEEVIDRGLSTRTEYLALKREVEQLSGDLATLDAEIPKVQAEHAEARARLGEIRRRFSREDANELSRVERKIAQLDETLAAATRQVGRTVIRTPIAGVVKKMRHNTIGGVVRPGEPIMEIVPAQDTLVVAARLKPVDRGYVVRGQRAKVKVSTYDFIRYGTLDGEVILIGADAEKDETGQPYFRVIVKTDRPFLGDASNPLPISPGMQAVVDIHTGDRSVFEYFIKPVLKLRHDAFRER